MRRPFVVLLVFLVPLFVTQAAIGADTAVQSLGNGQFVAVIQNTETTVLDSFTFVPGPGLTITGGVRSDVGSCAMSGSTFTCSGLGLAGGCACQAGGIVNVSFNGTGDGSGSSITQVGATSVNTRDKTTTTTTTNTTTANSSQTVQLAKAKATTTATKKAVAKAKVALCKKGQHSTKKNPCRLRT